MEAPAKTQTYQDCIADSTDRSKLIGQKEEEADELGDENEGEGEEGGEGRMGELVESLQRGGRYRVGSSSRIPKSLVSSGTVRVEGLMLKKKREGVRMMAVVRWREKGRKEELNFPYGHDVKLILFRETSLR